MTLSKLTVFILSAVLAINPAFAQQSENSEARLRVAYHEKQIQLRAAYHEKQIQLEGAALRSELLKLKILNSLGKKDAFNTYVENIDNPVIGAAIGILATHGFLFAMSFENNLGLKGAISNFRSMWKDGRAFSTNALTVMFAVAGGYFYAMTMSLTETARYKNVVAEMTNESNADSLVKEMNRVNTSIETLSKSIVAHQQNLQELKVK